MDQHETRQTRSGQTSTPSSVTLRIMTVYTFLLSGLAITALTVAVLLQVGLIANFVKNHFVITILMTSLLMTLNTSVFNRVVYNEQKMSKVMFWAINCILAGIPMLNIESSILIKASVYTAILFLILSLKSFIIPESVTDMFLKPLTAIHTLVLVCTVYSILFNSLSSFVSLIATSAALHGGFLVYSGLLICNTQRLMVNAKHPRFDPVFTSFVIYMNVTNLFSRTAVFSSTKVAVVEKGIPCRM